MRLLMMILLLAAGTARGVEEKARPFPLGDLRLLDGPFRTVQDIDRDYLMNHVEPDRLLAGFRDQAKLPKKAERYGGWEAHGINGHSLGHYLSALASCYAVTGDAAVKQRVDYIVDELESCQNANGDGYVLPVEKRVYDQVRAGEIAAGKFSLNRWWVPNYTMHKVFAGLRDAYRYAGNKKALEIERRFADWYETVVKGLDEEQLQRLLISEWGGMNEVLAQLTQDTGDAKYLGMAQKYFDQRDIFDPLKQGKDKLDGLHANTQVPKILGLALEYQMTGNQAYRTAAETFWNSVVRGRSFANGGHSNREHFFRPANFPRVLGSQNSETCNINNMIRLSGYLFQWDPNAERMDFVERALINQILTNIGRKPGEFGYFLSQSPVATKVFSTPAGAWWCCVGTGMENPMRYADQIYYHHGNELWTNLYMGSRLEWKEQGVTLTQTTRFPEEDTVRIRIGTAGKNVPLTLHFRHPYWSKLPELSVNGQRQELQSTPSSYFTLRRDWKDGDEVTLRLPMTLHAQFLPHSDDKIAAFLYGPMVLVGVVPPEADKPDPAKARWDDHLKAPGGTLEQSATVVLEKFPADLSPLFTRTGQDGEIAFQSKGLLQPGDLIFRPFHQIYEEHYTVYFPFRTPAEWSSEKVRAERQAKRLAEQEARKTDSVSPGFQQSEVNHNYKGQNDSTGDFRDQKYRQAKGTDGWFSYELEVDSDKPMTLVVTYSIDDNGRTFDLLIDGKLLVTEKLNSTIKRRFYDKSYALPNEMTAGKKSVTVRFQGNAQSTLVGGVFGLYMTR